MELRAYPHFLPFAVYALQTAYLMVAVAPKVVTVLQIVKFAEAQLI